MPNAPLKQCAEYHCPALVQSGRCPQHQKAKYKRQDANRGTPTERGYGPAHQILRVQCFIRDGWRCVECDWEPELVRVCRENDLPTPAPATLLAILRERYNAGQRHLHADHIRTIREAPELARDLGNMATMCDKCHRRKSRNEMMESRC